MPSNRLRNLAWIRHLLSSLDDVRNWLSVEGGERGDRKSGSEQRERPSVPPGWVDRPADAALLKHAFSTTGMNLHPDALRRSALLLDELLAPVFAGPEGAGGRYFSDRILRGLASPDACRLRWLDDLVPGSVLAFEREPAGVDRWFYDALDFTSPWFAKVFLWRAMDPSMEDPGWDELVLAGDAGSDQPEFTATVRDQRFADYTVSTSEVDAFESLIEHAAAVATYPSLVSAPAEELTACIDRIGAEASEGAERISADLFEAIGRLSTARQWIALSNAVAARRVSSMLGTADEITAWWLDAVHKGLTSSFRALEEQSYARLRKGRSPVDDVVGRLL